MGEALRLGVPAGPVAARFTAWRPVVAAAPSARVALFLEDRHDFAGALLAALAAGKQVVVPGDTLPQTLAALEAPLLPSPPGSGEATARALDLAEEALEVVVFTSGSTGRPTAIAKRLAQLMNEVRALEATFGADLGDAAVLSTVSHQHLYGLLFTVLWPLAAGRRFAAERFEFPEALEPALAAGPAVLVSSPAHLKRLPEGRPWRVPLRAVFSSGGPLSEDGAQRCAAVLGRPATEVYGSSETGGVAWRRRVGGEAWCPLPGVTWRVGAEGQLEVRSPHLPDEGWASTADRVEPVGDSFRLLGRADRVAKIEEKRVSLDGLERALVATGLLGEARVLEVPDGARSALGVVGVPTPAGAALLARGRRALGDALRAGLAGAVERVALPRRFRFVEQLPRNAQGKVTDAALQALFAPEVPAATLLARDGTHAEYAFTLDAGLRVFDGHFDGTPIVPGVAQVDWAVRLGRACFPVPRRLLRLDALKFQALMRVGHAVTLALDWSPEKSQLTFRYGAPTLTYSSGRLLFAPEGG